MYTAEWCQAGVEMYATKLGGGSVRCRMVSSTENPLAEHEHFCEDSKTLEQNDAAFVKTTAMQRVSPISAQ